MRFFLPLMLLLLALPACNNVSARQWLDPDTEFKEFGQPDVPTMQTTQEEQAKQALEKEDFARAAGIYKQLMDRKKVSTADQERYTIALADIDRRVGQYESAIAQYDSVLEKNSGQLDALEGKGLAMMAQGQIAEAAQLFKTVIAADAKRWRTLNALGILFTTKNMHPEAMVYYAEAMKVSKDNAAVLNNVGLSQAIAQNYQRAVSAMTQASRVAVSDARRKQIDLNLALIYGIQGDFDAARRTAEKHLSGATLQNNLGLYAHLANNQELAKVYLNQALSSSTTYYERAWKNLDIISGKGAGE